MDTIGRSTLDRPMVLLTISDSANLAELERLQAIQAKLADPRRITDKREKEDLVRQGRLIVLITAAIHPTEVGGTLVPLTLAYRLASATDEATREMLTETVILLVPSLNPDGVDAVAEWYRASVGTPWEGAAPPFLGHHYAGHDLNRDWYAFTQSETRNAINRVHNLWHPQIVHDIHQQGSTASRFFVPPWLNPIEPNVDPLLIAATNALGTSIAWEMQRQGKTGVVVNAGYDAWSPSRAYQHYHAGVRILSETASARLASPVELLPDELRSRPGWQAGERAWNHPLPWPGGRWSLGDILEYMESGALALLATASADRETWLENFVEIGERAVEGWPEWPAAWVIPGGQKNQAGFAELVRILATAQVEMQAASVRIQVNGVTYPPGSIVVEMRQPYAGFVQALLAPEAYPGTFDYPGGPPREPYDVTAHNLPLLLGVEAVAVSVHPRGDLVRLEHPLPGPAPHVRGVSGEPGLLVGLYQSRVPSPDEGWTRWLFDRYDVPYSILHDGEIRQGDLSRRFTAIVLPSSSPEVLAEGWPAGGMPVEFTGGLGSAGLRALREFAAEGGTLVALGRSSGYLIERMSLPVTDRLRGQPGEQFFAPGALVGMQVDTTTAVGRGVPAQLAAWIEPGHAFDLPAGSDAIRVAGYGSRPAVLSGWVHGVGLLAGAAAIVDIPLDAGRVVLFGVRPQYRGQSMATFPLLFNALRRVP
jgi:hypothetical protein